MTALEIVAVTAGLLVNGYLAISELRVDYLQRSHTKRLVADGYARMRAAFPATICSACSPERKARQAFRRVQCERGQE
jgi:hypothetical protein